MIAVVGAGAAGLLAAIHAAGGPDEVTLLERTADGGRKILISGGGRCNILPSVMDERRFVTDSSANTLKKILRAWPLAQQRSFFESDLGIPLEVEPETGKLFPRSNRAREVRDRLMAEARRRGVEIELGTAVHDVVPGPGGWRVQMAGGRTLAARAVILATGGLSVPATGSDGIGLEVARRLGHTINPTYPALTPLLADPAPHADLAGVSVVATVRGTANGRTASSTGGFLFTHRGYSGPAVLDVSHLATRGRASGGGAEIAVQWGGLDAAGWEERLAPAGAGLVAGAIRAVLPARLADRLLAETNIPASRELAQLRRAERLDLVERLARYRLAWTGDEGYRKAEVTGGGVALGEVDPGTLESRLRPGLFLCGEILDAFGPIGGYNFAWAWATGRTAGRGARAAD